MLGLANVYKCRPSTFLGIEDTYTSFCFDEACAYITKRLEDGEKPEFEQIKETKKYNSFTEFYKKYE